MDRSEWMETLKKRHNLSHRSARLAYDEIVRLHGENATYKMVADAAGQDKLSYILLFVRIGSGS
ncbi:hypothetical protein KC887_04410 [Candidatus Kaiserbacteria bacterium]|nr:hypothetical protein [Candidatus Kaiserbacteria bacterium]